jgi:hypothetical protein
MKRLTTTALLMGLGCALIPGAAIVAQAPAAQPASATAAPAIPADQQATEEQLVKLFDVMRLRQQFDNMMKMLPATVQQEVRAQMKEMMAQTPDAQKLTPEQQAAFDKLMAKYSEKAQNIYPVDQMMDDATAVYRRHMSRSDVDAYIAFYSSPPGQHLLDAQPVILREYVPVAMQRVQERSKDLYAQMAVDVQEFIKTQLAAKPEGGSQSSAPPAK